MKQAWAVKAAKMQQGKFVRVRMERMVLITIQGEPTEEIGESFKKEPQDELHFPVKFYDERAVIPKYKPGEAAALVQKGEGDDKIFPVASVPMLRAIREANEEEPVIGRTFIVMHTGQAKDTKYTFTEVLIPKQIPLVKTQEEEEEEAAEEEEVEEEEPIVAPAPPAKKPRAKPKPKVVAPVEEEEAAPATKRVLVEDGKVIVSKRTETQEIDANEPPDIEGESIDADDTGSKEGKAKFMKDVQARSKKLQAARKKRMESLDGPEMDYGEEE